jgi:hypothetical protein
MSIRRSQSLLATFAILVAIGLQPAQAQDYETTISGFTHPYDRDVAVDAQGNAYVISTAYDDRIHVDVLVVKLDPSGTQLWSRYIVGSDHDNPTDVALDASGDVYVVGWTMSDDFPLSGGMGQTLTGPRDAFIMKLDSGDGSILFSTLLGGDYTEEAHALAVDASGNLWVAGATRSTDFPVLDAWQDAPNAPLIYADAFLTRLTPDADAILYSTYFGGYQNDSIRDLALDSAGNPVFVGTTDSDDFPLVDPIDPAPNDLFVAKLSADGSTQMFGTYLGGEDIDRLGGMALSSDDFVYLAGFTRSSQFPTTPGAFQEQFVGAVNGCGFPPYSPIVNCDDGFLVKLATDGGGIAYGTYLGGTSVDEGHAVAVDGLGRAHVAGTTYSSDFPGGTGGSANIFVVSLSADGSAAEGVVTVPTVTGGGHGIAIGADGALTFTGTVNHPRDLYVARFSPPGADPVSISEGSQVSLPAGFALGPGVPNPFRGATTIDFEVPRPGRVELRIYDVTGALRRTVTAGAVPAGGHAARWDGRDDGGRPVAPGVYFAHLTTEGFRQSRKLTVLR